MGMAKNTRERGREQAGMSREGRRTMEKVLENTVRDIRQCMPQIGELLCRSDGALKPHCGAQSCCWTKSFVPWLELCSQCCFPHLYSSIRFFVEDGDVNILL